MCHDSLELTSDVDILVPQHCSNLLLQIWPSLHDYFNCPAQWLPTEKRGVLEIRYQSIMIKVDIILDSIEDFDYGTPDTSHPFRVLSLHKLIEHYFRLMDTKKVKEAQILRYIGGIQHFIERKKLNLQHNCRKSSGICFALL